MLKVRTNISSIMRAAGLETKGKNSIYNKIGAQLKDTLLDEFDVLVRETPQWTGTTAASWEIGFPSDIEGKIEEQPPRKREEALSKGSEAACSISMGKARGTITEDFSKYRIQDIVVSNKAPGFDRAEEGPVRPVNTPPGALARFEAKIHLLNLEVDLSK